MAYLLGDNGAQFDMDEKSQTYLISSRRDAYLIRSIDIVFLNAIRFPT